MQRGPCRRYSGQDSLLCGPTRQTVTVACWSVGLVGGWVAGWVRRSRAETKTCKHQARPLLFSSPPSNTAQPVF